MRIESSKPVFPASIFPAIKPSGAGRTTPLRVILSLFFAISAVLGLASPASAQSGFSLPASIRVGSTSSVQPITVNIQAAGTVGSINVLTQGAPNLDYSAASGGTCATGATYSAGATCILNVSMTPRYPGIRDGAVVVLDGSGNPMGVQLIHGVGVGPLSVLTAGEITTVAGNGHLSGSTLSTQATDAVIREPLSEALDGAGNLYYTDSGDNRIGKVDPSGVLTYIAGTGSPGYSTNGLAVIAQLSEPAAIIVDGAGNVYFTEIGNSTVREIVQATGRLVTIAGTGTQGYTGDGGLATSAHLNMPQGIALDASQNLFIADTGNNVIRKVSAADGTISTFAGNINPGFAGDGQTVANALFNQPYGISFGSDGTLYIADFLNNRIRAISPAGIVSTVAGNGAVGDTGDTGEALSATMDHPAAVAVDAGNNLYISDSENNVVRKVNAASGRITTLAGNSAADSSGDGVNADSGLPAMNKTYGLVLDSAGDLFIADRLGLRVREVYGNVGRIVYKDIKVTNTSPSVSQTLDNDGNAPLQLTSIAPVSNAAIDNASTTCNITSAMAPGAECVIGVEFKPTVVGSPVTGSISIASNAANSADTVYVVGNSLNIEPTTTTLASSVNPSAVGQTVTFTATVSSLATQLTGTVSFYADGTLISGSARNLNSNSRTASVQTSSLTLGSHTITAVFSGDGSSATSTSDPLTQVVKQTAALALSSNENPAHVYDAITFTVAVTETPSGGTQPAGSIVFSADGSLLPNGTIAIANGTATYTTSLLAAGSHTITATYTGDINNLPATSNALIQVVNVATTTTTLATSNASVLLTAPVTFTAQVTGNSSSIPTGNIVFKDGTSTIGTIGVNGSGIATLTTSTLSTGTHTITATYQGDTDYSSSTSAPLTQTVQKVATTSAVISSANPANAGATVRFTVTVTAANSTSPNVTITGPVTLMDGSTVLGTGALAAGGSGPATATVIIPVSSFGTGSHNVTAAYGGDTNYIGSTSSALSQSIVLATSSLILSSSASTAIATKPLTFTATLSSTGGTPSGSVTFMDGASAIGSANSNNGIATITTTALTVGTHTITSVYQGNTNDSAATSNALTITITAATTAVHLAPSQNPTNFGQSLTLTAAVTGNGGTPTGSVTFADGGSNVQTVPVNTSGVATYATSTLTDGTHPFTASYSGDNNDLPATSSVLNIQVLQTANLTLTSTSPNPSIARSNVHFVATITALQGIQPTGTITFKDGATVLGTGLINGGTATFDTASLSVGTHSIIASYAGDGSTQAITSSAYPQTINAAGTSVALASSASPATFGNLLTFTATATSTAGPLTGTVKFEDNGTTIGSGALSSTGVATFSTSTLAAGSHNIVAAYQGDSNDQPASSSTLVQVVERTSTVTLASSQNPLLTLAPVTITATVANGGGATPTGTVTFLQDSVAVSTVPVTAAGTATLAVTSLSAGTHSFTATYSGDAINFASTSTALSEMVQLRSTTDTLTTSASSLTGGQQLTLISVVRWTGSATPTGTVSFINGTQTLATAPVDSTGVATVTVLLYGTSANLSSIYSGDASYATSTSSTDLVTIGPAANFDFIANPPVVNVATTQHQMMTVTLSSLKGFTDTISLGCLGLPLAATCTFSTDQFMLTPGGMQSVQLTVDTGNPLLAGAQAKNEAPGAIGSSATKLIAACFLPGGLLLGLVGMRFRRLRSFGGLLMLCLLLAGMSTALTGCGTIKLTSTPPGVYNFAITATGKTGVSQSIPVTMTVTK
ncbi:sugar lactone lactonase YvrE [Granulicella aggregans]|uniref:Sugar lactone lactonase YvrE n=1 Tax=Granulicella aggregans TaxID=474949 RepID=A0A7W7Z9W2_9BACT|nr:Ig-like domain repeat protein [Granulicella aggregans]MBB5055739.1 sugar lactone lactonase YvrE [Granulicella aggregans]